MNKSVSLCMIVKNEAECLERCLSSVKDKVNEIIIVDTGSSDNTMAIANKFKIKPYQFKWNNNFAEARNFSIEKATSDYILILDADEFLDSNFPVEEILISEKDFYVVNIKNYMSNGYVSYHQAVRLFRNRIGLSYYGKIHEHLNIEELKNSTSEYSELLIHHDGYKQERYIQKDKSNRNKKILLKEVKESPTGYNLFNLGVQYKVEGEFYKALDCFKKAYFLSKDKVYVPYLLYLMGDCLLSLDRIEEGIHLMKDAIKLFPGYTGFYFALGNFYLKKGYLLDSELSYRKCLELGEVKSVQTIEGIGSYLANIKLSEVLQKQGKIVDSFEYAFNALIQKKNFAPSISQYIGVLIQSGIKKEDLLNNLKKIFKINNNEETILLLGVLLSKRSSILLDIILDNHLNVEKELLLVSCIYANRYKEAYELWSEINNIKDEYLIDILNLGFVIGDTNLISDIISRLSLTLSDKLLLEEFFTNRTTYDQIVSQDLTNILVSFLSNLVCMGEKDVFQIMADRVKGNSELTLLINKKTDILGFSDYVIHSDFYTVVPDLQHKFLGIKGDIELRRGNLKGAVEIYNFLYNQKPSYDHLNKLYNFYERSKDIEGKNIIRKELSLFPLSNVNKVY